MRRVFLGLAIAAWPLASVLAQDPQPTCAMCPATYINESEIQQYVKKAMNLLRTYTDADIHNLTAYLVTLK